MSGCELVRLRDRALEVIRQEELLPAVEIRELHDPEHVPEAYEISQKIQVTG